MHDRRLLAGGAAIALIAIAMVAFVLLSPRWAVGMIDKVTEQQLGRSFTTKGHARLDFSPLAIRFEDAALSGANAESDSFITAKTLVIPITFNELLSREPNLSAVTLSDAEIALLVDERGQASWDFPGLKAYVPMKIALQQVSFRYFDARNNHSLLLSNIDGFLDVRADGGASFSGTAVVNSRLLRIDADVKSLARVNQDGSPLELAIAADAATANFSGRLSTAKVLSLTGPISISSPAPADALHLFGLPVPQGTKLEGPLTIEGGMDSAGRAYAIRKASITLGAIRAAGDLVADLRGEGPKLQADLGVQKIWLDPFVPASGKTPGEWGRTPIAFLFLRGIEAEINIDAQALSYGTFTAAASRLAVTLKDGKLAVSGASRLADGGTASFIAKADASVLPPSVSLSFKAENAEAQPLLAALTGASQITGKGTFGADLSAEGTTQEELVGTLKGTASLSLAQGRIAGTDLPGLFAAARQKILNGWMAAPGGTPFATLNAEASIADGFVGLRSFALQTPNATFSVSVTGAADLLRQAVDLSATATAGTMPLLPVPVLAKGNWAAPRIYPNLPEILTNPEGGFARLNEVAPIGGN